MKYIAAQQRCDWFNMNGVPGCFSSSKTGHHSVSLSGGNKTVCSAITRSGIGDSFDCWGDNANNKLPVAFDRSAKKAEQILFADDFACAELKDSPGISKIACWGNKLSVVNSVPADSFKAGSLRVNNHVACAIKADNPDKSKVKCWGDFDNLMAPNNPERDYNFKTDVNGFVYYGDFTYLGGITTLKADALALGSDFICLAILDNNPAGYVNDRIICSGKDKFKTNGLFGAQFKTNGLDSLSAGDDFVCLKKTVDADSKTPYCFNQDAGGNLISAAVSADKFEWISAQHNYWCGFKSAPHNQLTCKLYPAGGAVPAFLSDLTNFTNSTHYSYSFGKNYMCGLLASGLIKCFGDPSITNSIPKYLAAP